MWLLNKELEKILKEPRKYEPLIKETEEVLSVSHELIVDTNYYSKDPKNGGNFKTSLIQRLTGSSVISWVLRKLIWLMAARIKSISLNDFLLIELENFL